MRDDSNSMPHNSLPTPAVGGVPGDVALNPAALLRAAADGELSPEQLAALDATQPDLAARVDFERSLKPRVSRAMCDPALAPESLRRRVIAALAAEREETEPRTLPLRPMQDGAPRHLLPRWAALAATIVLVAGVGFMSWSFANRAGVFGPPTAVQLASFVSAEHDRCSKFSDHFKSKFTERSPDRAEAAAAEILGSAPAIITMPVAGLRDGGYEFAGIGRCAVPGRGDSAHLLFADGTTEAANTISLFIQVDTGQLPLDVGTCYGCPLSETVKHSPVIWRDGGFLFYLFADDPSGLKRAEEAFKVPVVHRPMS